MLGGDVGNIGPRESCEGHAASYANGDVETWNSEGEAPKRPRIERFSQVQIGAVVALSDSVGQSIPFTQWPDSDPPLATFGFNLGIAKWVKEGQMLFATCDHPLVQTHLGVTGTLLIERLRLDPVSCFNGMTILTEPQSAGAEQIRRVTNALIPLEIQDRYLSEDADPGAPSETPETALASTSRALCGRRPHLCPTCVRRGRCPPVGRLGGLLQDLPVAHDRLKTAELLDVNERTLRRAESQGHPTEQLCRALACYEAGLLEPLEPGGQPVDAVDDWREVDRLTRRADRLDEKVQALSDDLREVPDVVSAPAILPLRA